MKKGFTLIELLAVIVILAIIALIATPIILGIINDAKEDSNKRSIENYAHAVELAVARAATKQGGVIEPGIYSIEDEGKTIKKGTTEIQIDYKGEAVTEGTIEVEAKGKIKLRGLSFGGKTKYNYSEKDGVTKVENEESGGDLASSPFKVTDDGILLHYERQGNETSVVVPAEVNGIKIKSIALMAFYPGDVYISFEPNILIGLNGNSEENKKVADELGFKFMTIDEFGKGNDPVTISLLPNASGAGKFLVDLDSKDYVISPFEQIEKNYLTDIDMSNMNYLEVISPYAFGANNISTSEACYSNLDCKVGVLESVKLPMNGVLSSIGDGAFAFNKISEIIIPDTVTTIYSEAFEYNQLTEIVIPASVTTIDSEAFLANPNLTKVIIKGDSSRFDSRWSYIFGSAEKVVG